MISLYKCPRCKKLHWNGNGWHCDRCKKETGREWPERPYVVKRNGDTPRAKWALWGNIGCNIYLLFPIDAIHYSWHYIHVLYVYAVFSKMNDLTYICPHCGVKMTLPLKSNRLRDRFITSFWLTIESMKHDKICARLGEISGDRDAWIIFLAWQAVKGYVKRGIKRSPRGIWVHVPSIYRAAPKGSYYIDGEGWGWVSWSWTSRQRT